MLTAIGLALLLPAGDWAYFEPDRSIAVLGASADGKAYAVATIGRFELERDRGTCKYPTLYGHAGVDEFVVEVCALRGACERFPIATWAADENGLAPAKCTPAATVQADLKKLGATLLAKGIDTTQPGEHLVPALQEGLEPRVVELGAADFAQFGIDASVVLASETDGSRGWLTATAKDCGTQRIQNVHITIAASGLEVARIPHAPFLVVLITNGRWALGRIEVPLARIAVRLLTGRAEKNGSLADVDRALALDASYAPAQKLRARLVAAKPSAAPAKP